VYLDSGIETGTDVVRALALGARAVFVGRAPVWGLSWDGADGVRHVLEILTTGLREDMRHLGVTSIDQLGPHVLSSRAARL
jgi:isopentenyl diphosphate isomerase/L-lactate dehydrogenase-like FMN-dependent dehydrogenase